MFITLLVVTFIIAVVVTHIVAMTFRKSIARILERILSDPIASAWQRYVTFGLYVVGIPGGVRIWELEKYISPRGKDEPALLLNLERWVLEVYRTVIETLQSTAWLLLLFFGFALLAYVIVRIAERKPVAVAAPAVTS